VSAFRAALPLLSVTLVNKVMSLSMSLLPAIVVARALPPGQAAAVVGLARGAAVVGTLASGALADRFGAKWVLVGSIALSGAGALGMARSVGAVDLAIAAAATQIGLACFPVLNRVLLAGAVPLDQQREALAWLRTTANLGLVMSFALGGAFGTHVTALLVADAVGSWLAAALGAALLTDARRPATPSSAGASTWRPFLYLTAVMCAWGCAYEGFLTACAAQLRATWGPEGVSVFAWVMVLNTVGCALLGVVVARRIEAPDLAVPVGFALLLAGAALGVTGSPAAAFVGMALATAGELAFSATAQFAWMALTPEGPRKATVFSVAMTASFLARAAGAALVFPLVVHAPFPALGMAGLVVPGVLLSLAGAPAWAAFRTTRGVR
jgi:AAHS family 3-hydroxyphenylpropionic acid transporter